MAERLYYDSSQLVFVAEVVDIRLDSKDDGGQLWQVALDRTAFYPKGGGQPWDTGELVATAPSGAVLAVAVERVQEDEHGEVWHYVRKPLMAGTRVEGRVDRARRLDHAQQHSGQHLLSAVFLRELGAATVGFHLGATASTIDLKLADGAVALGPDAIARVECAANLLAAENRSMTPLWRTREEAEAMLARGELRKLPEREGPMRVVAMRDVEWNACGGTHVAATGEIGAILLRKVERAKGNSRVEFVCGARAIAVARRDFELLRQTAATLSVGAADVPERVANLLAEAKASAKDLKTLRRNVETQNAAE